MGTGYSCLAWQPEFGTQTNLMQEEETTDCNKFSSYFIISNFIASLLGHIQTHTQIHAHKVIKVVNDCK